MEKQLYIFNPWHDMALANFTPYFKVSSEILRMSCDLCFLPVWYAPDDAYIRVYDTDTAETFISQVSEFRRFEKSRFVENGFACDIVPWGWSPSLVHMLVKDGVDSSFLPNHETLDKIRSLSGRQRCVDVLSELSVVESTCGKAFCCYSMEEVKNYLQIYGKLILKSPWSGSGRGLCRVSPDVWSKNIEGWISRILRTQGCVMAEPIYNKVCDFAMEFYSSPGGSVSFAGYSLFETDAFGNYKQNLLLSDDEIETRLLSYNIPFDTLREVRRRLIDTFNNMIAGAYTGYFGVDMMLCFQDEKMLLHPCVEINMRMNMGVVSRIICDSYLSSSSHGYFVTEHYNSDGEALLSHRKMLSEQHLVLDPDGRIKSGYLTLTPVLSSTRYQAYVIVKE